MPLPKFPTIDSDGKQLSRMICDNCHSFTKQQKDSSVQTETDDSVVETKDEQHHPSHSIEDVPPSASASVPLVDGEPTLSPEPKPEITHPKSQTLPPSLPPPPPPPPPPSGGMKLPKVSKVTTPTPKRKMKTVNWTKIKSNMVSGERLFSSFFSPYRYI